MESNVCVVDTSNEIAGDGDVPHPCIGLARRMMVPSLDEQIWVWFSCLRVDAYSIFYDVVLYKRK